MNVRITLPSESNDPDALSAAAIKLRDQFADAEVTIDIPGASLTVDAESSARDIADELRWQMGAETAGLEVTGACNLDAAVAHTKDLARMLGRDTLPLVYNGLEFEITENSDGDSVFGELIADYCADVDVARKELRVPGGHDISQAAHLAVTIADRLNKEVSFEFSYVPLAAAPGSDPRDIVREFYSRLETLAGESVKRKGGVG